jgi:hypothetical protein
MLFRGCLVIFWQILLGNSRLLSGEDTKGFDCDEQLGSSSLEAFEAFLFLVDEFI